MSAQLSSPRTALRPVHAPPANRPAAPAAAGTPLEGIERLMAEALDALGAPGAAAADDPGAVEYESWLRRLRRATP